MNLTSNKSDLKLYSKSEISSNLVTSSNIKKSTLCNQLETVDHDFKRVNESAFTKSSEHIKIDKSSTIENLNKDSDSRLPEFSDSRLRLNKLIGFAANASIEKLNIADESVSNAEIAKQVFNEITKQSKNTAICQNMLKDINMDDIDVNHVKRVIESIKSINMVPVKPPPLPPIDLMDFGRTRFELTSSVESNNGHLLNENVPLSSQPISLVPNKSSTIRDKLNSDINMYHKIGSSNEHNKKFITALKPGTLIDLENSKVTRSSLLMESIRTVVPSNEKCSDIKQFSPPPVARDPRIRNKSLLNPENNNPGQPPLQANIRQLKSSILQNPGSINSSHLSPNINHLPNLGSQQETSHVALSVYNGQANYQISSNYTNIQPFGNLSPTEQNDKLNQSKFVNCRPSNLNQYRPNRNDFLTTDGQHSIPNLLHNNTLTHNELMMNNRDPVSPDTYNYHNDLVVKRDPRSMNLNRNLHEPQYSNFKEYREAKYGKEKYSNYKKFTKNKDKKLNNLEQHRYRNFNLENEKFISSNKTLMEASSIKTLKGFGVTNDLDGIKNFKIPKIKRNDELVQNLKNDFAEDDLKVGTIKDNNIGVTGTIENKDSKNTSTTNIINNNNKVKKIIIKAIEGDEEKKLKIDESQEINLKKSTINRDNKGLTNIDDKQSTIIKESIDESTKTKKPKKCSKEKEFEKIVKEAAASLNDDVCGPRTRTRSSLKKIEETTKKIDSKENKNNLNLGECSKSIENIETSIEETGQDVISSTSKELFEVEDKIIEDKCKNLEENTVSSNVINSTEDVRSNQLVSSSLIDLKNPGLLTLIEILQDEQKRLKLQEFLNATDKKITNEDESKNKNLSHEEYSDLDKQKKLRKKMRKKEKKLRQKMNQNNAFNKKKKNEKSDNTFLNNSIDDSSNNESIVVIDNSNDENSNTGVNYDNLSTDQDKVKSSKRKKSKENYGNFEIKDKNLFNTELKNLKIVIAKNVNKNKSSSSKVSNEVQTPCESKHLEKSKKPFFGPLSVKLAKERLATDQNNFNNDLDENNEIISKSKEKKSFKSKNKKIKTNVVEESSVLVKSDNLMDESSALVEKSVQDECSITDQNPKQNTPAQSNIDNKTEIKKSRPKMTELDKLHADISEMYDCDALLNASNIRHCRLNKQIDYVNTVVLSRRNRTSVIKQLDDENDEFISGEELLKTPKKQKNKSKLKINKKVYTSRKRNTKEIVPRKTIKSALLKKNVKSLKKSKKLLNFGSCNKSQLNNVSNNNIEETIQLETIKRLTEDDFKDISYFQTVDNVLECKFCYYNDTGLNIVRHYIEQHSKEEVLPSRLSINCAEILINESLKENFGFINVQDLKPLRDLMIVNTNFTCVFCQTIFYDITCFYDHITGHTGEYRYKCKACKMIYQNEVELEKHILEHSNYDKSEGISHLLHSNLIGSNRIFGYLCPFCYYIQLDYYKIVNHLTARHINDDKKFNGYWTVIRVNMSIGDDDYTNSIIDYSNLVGCLPPIINDEVISKDVNKKFPIHEISVSTLVAQKKKALKDAASLGIPITEEDKVDLSKLNPYHSSQVEVIPCK